MTNTNQQLEIWVDIFGYIGKYQVSNFGNVKSLSRIILRNGKYPFLSKERIMSKSLIRGYYGVVLYKEGKGKTFSVHQLVAQGFLNHTPCKFEWVVNHKNFIRTDNRVENLEIVTSRENSNYRRDLDKLSSRYSGVIKLKNSQRYRASITIKGKQIIIGNFSNEFDAHRSYLNAVENHKNGLPIKIFKPKFSSKHKGVSWTKDGWTARICINKKTIYLGLFKTEKQAYEKYREEREKMQKL